MSPSPLIGSSSSVAPEEVLPAGMASRSSRIPGFYQLSAEERLQALARYADLDGQEIDFLRTAAALTPEKADKMVENAIGIHAMPLGLGLNFFINGRDYLVPMAIEEASVVASASYSAKLIREAGGFIAGSSGRIMIGQIQVVHCPNLEVARQELLDRADELIELANRAYPSMAERGGGARELEVRILGAGSSEGRAAAAGRGAAAAVPMLVAQFYIDTQDAMGANVINTMMEAVAPVIEEFTGGRVYLRILSNLTDRCLAWSQVVLPPRVLKTGHLSGEDVVEGILMAQAFADADPYRAATHNKGVMNGIDAVVIATGNDWRAIEAGCHAYAARDGQYGAMTHWSRDGQGNLVGRIELPMAVGTAGVVRSNPASALALKILGVETARELAEVIVSVGLAQNLAAIKALATEGIQKGHMALHARNVAMSAGARGDEVEEIALAMVQSREIRLAKALELLNRKR